MSISPTDGRALPVGTPFAPKPVYPTKGKIDHVYKRTISSTQTIPIPGRKTKQPFKVTIPSPHTVDKEYTKFIPEGGVFPIHSLGAENFKTIPPDCFSSFAQPLSQPDSLRHSPETLRPKKTAVPSAKTLRQKSASSVDKENRSPRPTVPAREDGKANKKTINSFNLQPLDPQELQFNLEL